MTGPTMAYPVPRTLIVFPAEPVPLASARVHSVMEVIMRTNLAPDRLTARAATARAVRSTKCPACLMSSVMAVGADRLSVMARRFADLAGNPHAVGRTARVTTSPRGSAS